MSMNPGQISQNIYLLKWSYEPKDFFEDGAKQRNDRYEMNIENGLVEVRINAEVYSDDMPDELTKTLDALFGATLVKNHHSFKLCGPIIERFHAGGRKDVTVMPEPARITLSSPGCDILVTDSKGEVVLDSRRDRIADRNGFASLAAKHRSNPVVLKILQSYKGAVEHPENELVYLYEICDGIKEDFSGAKVACKTLGIDFTARWKWLTKTACDKQIKQGRHRGQHPINQPLRDATPEELRKARSIATEIIEKYLRYLDGQKQVI
jgi:hypothetical protein